MGFLNYTALSTGQIYFGVKLHFSVLGWNLRTCFSFTFRTQETLRQQKRLREVDGPPLGERQRGPDGGRVLPVYGEEQFLLAAPSVKEARKKKPFIVKPLVEVSDKLNISKVAISDLSRPPTERCCFCLRLVLQELSPYRLWL